MFCQYCGRQIDDDSIFCAYCGKKISEEGVKSKEEKPQPNPSTPVSPSISMVETPTTKGQQSTKIDTQQEKPKRKKLAKIFIIIISIPILFFLLILLIGIFSGNDENVTQKPIASEPIPQSESVQPTLVQTEPEVVIENEEELQLYPDEEPYSEYEADGEFINYKGEIDDKYPITLEIAFENNKLFGTYYYDKSGSDNRLSFEGLMYDDEDNIISPIVLTEFNKDGKVTGRFILNESGISDELSGTFVVEKTGKEMPFRIQRIR